MKRFLYKLKQKRGAVNGLVVGALVTTVLILATFAAMKTIGQNKLENIGNDGLNWTKGATNRLVNSM